LTGFSLFLFFGFGEFRHSEDQEVWLSVNPVKSGALFLTAIDNLLSLELTKGDLYQSEAAKKGGHFTGLTRRQD